MSHLIGAVDPNLDASVGGSTHHIASTESAAVAHDASASPPSASVEDMLAALAATSGSASVAGGDVDGHVSVGGSGISALAGGSESSFGGDFGGSGIGSGTDDAGAASIAAALALATSSSTNDVQALAQHLTAASSLGDMHASDMIARFLISQEPTALSGVPPQRNHLAPI